MTKISTSSMNRIRNMYVARNTSVTNTGKVASVDRVQPVTNDTLGGTPNTLINYQRFYDTLRNMRKTFKNYYDAEQELKDSLNEVADIDMSKLLEQIQLMVGQYNLALSNLYKLEARYGGSNVIEIKRILGEFKPRLFRVGIKVIDMGYLEVDDDRLSLILERSIKDLMFIFEPRSGFLTKMYERFRNIRVDKPTNNFLESETKNISGGIIDRRG